MARHWILLRGLAREAGHWADFTDKMKGAFPDDQVECVDLPGMGQFSRWRSPFRVSGILKHVRREVLRSKNPQSELHLLAVSLGGMLTLEWMASHPGEVKRAVVINSSSSLSPLYHRMRWQIWTEFFSGVLQMDPKQREKKILELVANSPERRAQILPVWEKIAVERPPSPFTFAAQLLAASQFQVPSHLAQTQALFLVGLGDRLVEPQCSEELASHFKAPLRKHPWAGHDLAVDDPDWIIENAKSWLAESKV